MIVFPSQLLHELSASSSFYSSRIQTKVHLLMLQCWIPASNMSIMETWENDPVVRVLASHLICDLAASILVWQCDVG